MKFFQLVFVFGILTFSWTFATGLANLECPRIMTATAFACHGKLRTANELLRHTSPNTTLLDISQNFIPSIHKDDFRNLAALVTMNLSYNAIEFMESGAFDGLRQLVTLDLSHNKLRILHSALFNNLNNLERLLLAGNFISQIPTWSSEILPALNYLDLASTPLICDCGLTWLSERVGQGKIKLSESTSCFTPSVVQDRKFSSLKKDEFNCSTEIQFPYFAIVPAKKKIIVPGDSFRLVCSATNLLNGGGTHMAWIHNGVGVSELKYNHDLSHEKGLFSASIEFVNITEKHAGNWSCRAWTSRNDETISTQLFVLHDTSPHCPSNITVTTRGTYWWPKTFAQDISVELPCEDNNLSPATVKHVCDRSGQWRSLDVSSCPFRTEFERVLKEYIRPLKLNEAILASGLLRTYLLNQSAIQVVSNWERLDLVLQAVEAVMRNQTDSPEILSDAAKIADWLMDAPFVAWQTGEELRVSQRLMKILIASASSDSNRRLRNYIAAVLPSNKKNSAEISEKNSQGIFCEIFAKEEMSVDCYEEGKRPSKSNGPASSVLFIPAFPSRRELLLFAFRNVKFFAALVERGNPVPSSLVVGVFPRDFSEVDVFHEVFTVEVASPLLTDRNVPLYFSPSLVTQDNNCNVVGVNFETGVTKLACKQFGLVTVTQPLELLEAYQIGAFPNREIPIFIYTCAAVTILVHISLLFIYASYFISLPMPRLYKHCLLNLWIAVDALIVVFVCGFNEIFHKITCVVIGVLLHYFTICCLLWIFLSFYLILKSARKSRLDSAITKPDSDGVLRKNRPNFGGIYLFGWGVPLILTGISAAVYTSFYAGQRFCYLRMPHSLLAIVLPSTVIVLGSFLFFVLILCLKSSKRTNLDPENFLVVREESQGRNSSFDTIFSHRSHAVSLFLYLIFFLLSYFLIGSWAGNGYIGSNRKSDWKSVHEYGIGISFLLFSLIAICAFWLLRKDLPKTCWAASKKVALEDVGNRTILPVQEFFSPLLNFPISHSEIENGRISENRKRNSGLPSSTGRDATENAYSFQNSSGHAVSYASSSGGFVTVINGVTGSRRYSAHRGGSDSSKMETCI